MPAMARTGVVYGVVVVVVVARRPRTADRRSVEDSMVMVMMAFALLIEAARSTPQEQKYEF